MNTLNQFLAQHLPKHKLPQELASVLESVATACLDINAKVRLGALSGVLGMAGTGNIQGEDQKKLDVIANNIMIDVLKANANIAGLASEEEDTYVATHENGGYLVLFDPLDGSSNIDVNISVGTIFSILAKPEGALTTESFLQKGRDQVAAGYVLYGPQTQLVLTVGHGVFVFTLDDANQFLLTKENPRVPESTKEFAINMSNQRHWFAPVQQYIDELLAGDGVFMYPQDKRDPSKPGKLRLMYEANPMSLLMEQAGGASNNAIEAMLDIQPTGLHQRVAVFMGSREEVEYVYNLHQK